MGSMRDFHPSFAEPRQQSRNKHPEETLRRTVKKRSKTCSRIVRKANEEAYVLFEVVSEKLRSVTAVGVSVGEDGELRLLKIKAVD